MSVTRAIEILKNEGLKVIGRKKGKKHPKLIASVAENIFLFVCPKTPSDFRWEKNFRAYIRRALRARSVKSPNSEAVVSYKETLRREYGYCEPQNPFGHGHFE